MNREAWRRWTKTMMAGRERRRTRLLDFPSGIWETMKKQQQQQQQASLSLLSVENDCGIQGLRRIFGLAEWQSVPALPDLQFKPMQGFSFRNYAAPLSRPAKSSQNAMRLPKTDPNAPPEPDKSGRKINRAIVSRHIRLITEEGHQIFTRMEALRHAENMDLDLVEVDGKQDPPVCKLMDFNKERFKERQREKDIKRRQSDRRRLDDLKEVRFSTRTEPNDLELKAQMALRLLAKGHRVKLAVIPHGNDDLRPKGVELIDHVVSLLQGRSKVETGPRVEKQRAWVLIRPTMHETPGTPKKENRKVGMTSGKATVDNGGGPDMGDEHG